MYQIKVLDSNEFDQVSKSDPRYSYVDETNLGFADRQKGVAYVRDSQIHDLNKYLINHELEELIEKKSEHEDPNGIRHKKGGFFKNFYDPLGLFHQGNILGIGHNEGKAGLGELINPLMGLIGGGVGSAFGGPAGGAVGSAIGNAAKSFMPKSKAQNRSGMEQETPPGMNSLFGQFNLPNSQSQGMNLPDSLSPGANITSGLNQGLQGLDNVNLSPEERQRRMGFYRPINDNGRMVL